MKALAVLFGLILTLSTLTAQQRISNFNNENLKERSSDPTNFTIVNNSVIYYATTEMYGKELWVSNVGEPDNATLLKDIYPGRISSKRGPGYLPSVTIDNNLYFIAQDPVSAGELWKTNGTSNGTIKITHFLDANIRNLTLIGDDIFFIKKNGSDIEIWKSDGTEDGTLLIRTFTHSSFISFEGQFNQNFVFTINSTLANTSKLWISDGTYEGTKAITDPFTPVNNINSGYQYEDKKTRYPYIILNNELYFIVESEDYFGINNPIGLIRTDGNLENTVAIKSLYPEFNQVVHVELTSGNNDIFLSFQFHNEKKLDVWSSNGAENGTNQIWSKTNSQNFITSNIIYKNNKLIFIGPDSEDQSSILSLDLQNNNAITKLQLISDSPGSNINHLIEAFYDKYLIYSYSVWITDLTNNPNNTYMITSLNTASNATPVNQHIYFSKDSDFNNEEPMFISDINALPQLVKNINQQKFSHRFLNLTKINNEVLVAPHTVNEGTELWKKNENQNNFSILKDINEGNESGLFILENIKYSLNDEYYFSGNDSTHGHELWKTDGTTEGTVLAFDVNPGEQGSLKILLGKLNDEILFLGKEDNINTGSSLYKTDGTSFELIKNGNFPWAISQLDKGLQLNNSLFFSSYIGNTSIWRTDGTEAGTYPISDINSCLEKIVYNNQLYFISNKVYPGNQYFKLNSTDESGLNLVEWEKFKGMYNTAPTSLTVFDDFLYFIAKNDDGVWALLKSDGTEEGTATIKTIDANNYYPNYSKSDANHVISKGSQLCVFNNELYFTGYDEENGLELWKTDGTVENTSLVADINEGETGSYPQYLTVLDDLIYFNAFDTEYGNELWKSDGTEEGTVRVADIAIGLNSSFPESMIKIDNTVYFTAVTENNGHQVYQIEYDIVDIPKLLVSENIIYPNPVRDYIYFENNEPVEKIVIYNMMGQITPNSFVEKNDRIDVSNLASGHYIMVLYTKENKIVNKFIKN